MQYIYGHIIVIVGIVLSSCNGKSVHLDGLNSDFDTVSILDQADSLLALHPETITAYPADRSKGGHQDYYSEGPYWYQNPDDPTGPYIRKDGQRNPDMFKGHRSALKSFEDNLVLLTAAYSITQDSKYSEKAKDHLTAWFISEKTKMNPHLTYAQAIRGIVDGRGIGIIDAVGLINVVNAIKILEKKNNLSPQELTIIKKWFSDFTHWLTTSKNGNDAAENGNNHSTWWGAQVASYCSLTGNTEHYTIAEAKFIELLDHQMKEDGRFPEELDRTKPWHYMNYNIRAWANFALLLSNEEKDFWNLEGKNGTIKKAFDFNFNYLKSPADWPYQTELEKSPKIKPEDHFYMASKALQEPKYKTIWSQLIPQNGMNSGRLFLFSKLYDL